MSVHPEPKLDRPMPGFSPTSTSAIYVPGRTGGLRVAHAAAILVLPAIAVVIAASRVVSGEVQVWQPVLAVALYVATMTGITVGFHRLLAHRAFQAGKPVSAILVVLGCMAAQGPPIYWVSNHRRHHQFCDVADDPHSPHQAGQRLLSGWAGFWHGHVGWTFTHELTNPVYFCKDLLRDRTLVAVSRHYYAWVVLGLVLPAIIGGLVEGSIEGLANGFLWGAGVRLFLSYHLTNSINSITHMIGYRAFDTPDRSVNNLLLGVPTLGEAWHNNHHAFPSSAVFGLSWWEFDFGGSVVSGLERLGLIWNVRRPGLDLIAQKRRAATEVRPEKEGGP